MRNIKRRMLPRRGATTVEFAATFPILLLVVFACVEFSRIMMIEAMVEQSAFEAARNVAVLGASTSEGEIIVGRELGFFGINNPAISIEAFRGGVSPTTEAELRNNGLASGIQVNAAHHTLLFFEVGETTSSTPQASSVATQMERDIALIIDRSGSMFSFEGQVTNPGQGEEFLFNTITDLYDDPDNGIEHDEYILAIGDYQKLPEAAKLRSHQRVYSDKILKLLSGDLKEYALSINADYSKGIAAPKLSRWHGLELAWDAFFDVLEKTDQTELVSAVSFSSDAKLEISLTSDLEIARTIPGDIYPTGSTAIGKGMLQGFDSLNADAARLSAVKTLIVLSDGINSKGTGPVSAANQIIAKNPNTVIHSVTFGAEADITEMAAVARIGSGKHFHAKNTAQLIEVFKELAASHRTLITD